MLTALQLWLASRRKTLAWAMTLKDANDSLSSELAYQAGQLADVESAKVTAESLMEEKDRKIQHLVSEIEILKERISMFEIWQAREFARLEAETAIHVRAKVDALESPRPDMYE